MFTGEPLNSEIEVKSGDGIFWLYLEHRSDAPVELFKAETGNRESLAPNSADRAREE